MEVFVGPSLGTDYTLAVLYDALFNGVALGVPMK